MKILFIVSGNKKGKPGAVVQNQADSLNEAGIMIDFFLVRGKGFAGYLKNIFPLWKFIKNHPSTIVHSHYSLSAMATSIVIFFSPARNHIVSLMGSDTQLKGLSKVLVKFFHRFCWTKTIVKSEKMLVNAGIGNALVIPNGVNIKKIEQIENNGLMITDYSLNKNHKKIILFAADPSRESKNYPLAILAMKSINAELKIVFEMPHAVIIEEILHADVLLLTSHWEGSPNIVKEAMACNCPIVSTNVGDVEWLFGNEPGHFIATFEPEDVAEKIEMALEFAREVGRTNGRRRVLELGLDAETVARRLVGVYEEVMGKSGE